jgi:hypothetical protein
MVGYTYSWGKGTISFNGPSKLKTAWGPGYYRILDRNTVEAIWKGYTHTIVFNETFTQYISIRKKDLDCEKGSVIPSDEYYIKYPKAKILVLMSDNRPLNKEFDNADFWSYCAYINKQYCNKHNYDFLYLNNII